MAIQDFKYYLYENKYVFRCDTRTNDCYLLTRSGDWVKSAHMCDVYYDAGSDYTEISYEEIDNPIRFKKAEDIRVYSYDGKTIIDEDEIARQLQEEERKRQEYVTKAEAERNKRIRVINETLDVCAKHPELKQAVSNSIEKQCVYWQGDCIPVEASPNTDPAQVFFSRKRTMEAAASEKYRGYRIGILNFASSINPGGGVLKGTVAQEEGLCRISSLYPPLAEEAKEGGVYYCHRQWIHSGEMGRENRDDCIYTPDVVVFRKDVAGCEFLPEEQWYRVDVITCAAPDHRSRFGDDKFSPTPEELKELLTKRIDVVFRIAIQHGIEVLVLGAFGCGVFGNPPELVAKAFETGIKKYANHFKFIEFAVYSSRKDDANQRAFSAIDGIITEEYQEHLNITPLPEAYAEIDGNAIEKTICAIRDMAGISKGDYVGQWVSDETLRPHLREPARKFEGGVRGLIAYKRYKYALSYVSPDTQDMRYRFAAAAILLIGNGFHFCQSDTFSEDEYIPDVYQKTLSAHLRHKYPLGTDCFMDHGFDYQKKVEQVQTTYRMTGSVEALTLLKVLKALEWNEEKIKALEKQVSMNAFCQ